MKPKKNSRANLEKYRAVFFQAGLLITLSIVFIAFNWPSKRKTLTFELPASETKFEEEYIPPPTKEPDKKEPELRVTSPRLLSMVSDDYTGDEEYMVEEIEDYTQYFKEDVILPEEDFSDSTFIRAEEMPEFPGGERGLISYISGNFRYPSDAREVGITGKIFLRFVVMEDGSVDRISVIRSVHPSIDKEAVRVIKSLPKWKPGYQRGIPVKVWYHLPINCELH